jgi:hypothetical protein
MSFFSSFFQNKIGEQEDRTGPAQGVGGLVPVRRRKRWVNGEGG